MHVLITGGDGLLGRAVASHLLDHGQTVHLTSRTPREEPRPGVGVSAADVTDPQTLAGLPAGIDAVVHTAAMVSTRPNTGADVELFWRVNTGGTRHVLEWSERAGVRTFVYCSTVSVYAPGAPQPLREDAPTLPGGDDWAYALSKLAGEVLALKSTLRRVFVLRFSTLFGPGMLPGRAIPVFLDRIRRGASIDMHSAGWTGDYLYVKDAAAAVWCALSGSHSGGVFNIGSGIAVTLPEVVETVREVAAPAARITTTSTDDKPTVGSRVDISHAREALGYAPRFSLRSGLADWLGEPA